MQLSPSCQPEQPGNTRSCKQARTAFRTNTCQDYCQPDKPECGIQNNDYLLPPAGHWYDVLTMPINSNPTNTEHAGNELPDTVLREQVCLLYQQATAPLLLSQANAFILSAVLWSALSPSLLLGWLGLFSVVISTRLYWVQRGLRRLPHATDVLIWRNTFGLGVFISGCLWGVAGSLLFPGESAQHLVFLAIILAGTSAGGMTTLSWVRGIFPLFLLPMLTPFALRLMWQGTLLSVSLALLIVLYSIVLLNSSRSLYRTTTDAIRLRFENLALANDLHQTNRTLQAEQAALQEARNSYQDIFETASEGIYVSTPEGQLIRANPALARLNGYDSEAETLAAVHDIARESYVEPHRRDEFKRLLALHGQVENFTSEIYRHKTRERIWVSENARAVYDQGRILFYQGTMRDITQQKQAEQALIEAKEAAETTARLKSEFLTTISHEIRTPIHGVLGMTELLQTTTLDDKQQRYATNIQRSGERLLRIVNDILDFSNIVTGNLHLEHTAFSPRELLFELSHDCREQAQHKQLKFSLIIENALPERVLGDRDRLRQVLANLLGNAVKFTNQGSIELFVRQEQNSADNTAGTETLYFSVKDTGVGIPPELQSLIFDSFVQADGSLTRSQQGAGLGLAICQQLVELMGGQLRVDSQPGTGSTFSFSVTLERANSASNDSNNNEEAVQTTAPPDPPV